MVSMSRSPVRRSLPLRAVFLDIGDTVMRPAPSWEAIYAVAFREFGVPVEIEPLRVALRAAYHHGGWGMEGGFEPSEETSFRRTVEIDQQAIATLGLGPMPEAFFRRLSQLFTMPENWHVFPEVGQTLEALRDRGLTVGAVSNWVWTLPDLLGSLGLVDYFDFIAASARVGFEKPHPEIFRYALSRARAEAGEVIHVGDHVDADVEGATAVGISAALIDRHGRHRRGEVAPEVPIISTLDEVLPIVDARRTADGQAPVPAA
jgi:REG-2-like HAD superfamily hydrolase